MMKAVYIHIPFCHSICNYCDFCKLYYDKSLVKPYLKSLEKEIESIYQNEELETIYIGGGTPSALELDELEMLFDILERLKKDKVKEYTIECNIENLNRDKLLLFKEKGINRLSIGVQTFNEKLLNILGRNHNREMVKSVIQECKNVGINNINIDLIYGVDGETLDDLKSDIEAFLDLNVPHISFYSLIIEPHTKLYIKSFNEMDEDLNLEMYNYIKECLKKHHYNHYEISNFAKNGYESKHNLVYWHNEEYYGFGLGAASFLENIRYDNTRSITNYIKGIYKTTENILSDKEMMENEMILGLRLTSGVNKNHFYNKYNKNIEDVFKIDTLLQEGQLVDKNNCLYIPDDKLFISNSILLNFID